MDLTWSALLVIILIVTPAFCALATFRALHPKIRYIHNSNFISIIFPSLFSLLVNIPLIGFYIDKALRLKVLSCNNEDLNLIYEFIFSHHTFEPLFRPALSLTNWFSSKVNDLDIVIFYLDIHLRVVCFAVLLSVIFLIILKFDEYLSSLSSLKDEEFKKVCCISRCFRIVLGYGANLEGRHEWYHQCRHRWFAKFIHTITNGMLFHQWNQLIGDNTRAQTVFCDIFFEDDNMYSGMLENWLPKDTNEVSSFSLTCVFRYYPNTVDTNGKIVRKWKFIVNNGTLILPFPRIKTINIWKLSIGTSMRIAVNNDNDLEKLKWYLAIWHHKKNIFSSAIINVDFENKFKNTDEFYEYLDNFLTDSNYVLPMEKITSNVVKYP